MGLVWRETRPAEQEEAGKVPERLGNPEEACIFSE
jgi:hypothetical protein